MYGCCKDCLILIPFRLLQISCFTLRLTCFSSDSDNCPSVGIWPLLQFPHPLRAGPVLLTLLFFPLVPSSYRVLCGSIYSFPLVKYSCPLSAGVLHSLLYLKVYSWYICGERCTPRPPTAPQSCSQRFILNGSYQEEWAGWSRGCCWVPLKNRSTCSPKLPSFKHQGTWERNEFQWGKTKVTLLIFLSCGCEKNHYTYKAGTLKVKWKSSWNIYLQ